MFRKLIFVIIIILCITPLFAGDLIEEKIHQLNKEIEDFNIELAKQRKKAQLWLIHSKESLEYEHKRKESDPLQIERYQKIISILNTYMDTGLSDTLAAGRMVRENYAAWLKENELEFGWYGNGLDQLSALHGIYYEQKTIDNKKLMIDILNKYKKWGISYEKYLLFKRQINEIERNRGGIYPYNGVSEARGMNPGDLLVLYQKRKETGLPEPGTKDYKKLEQVSLLCLQNQGYDSEKLMEFNKNLHKRIRTLSPTEELPGFFESIGFSGGMSEEEKTAQKTEWQAALSRAAHIWWLKMIDTCDGKKVLEGLKHLSKTLGKFDQALQYSTDAAIDQIQGVQTLTENILSQIPLINISMTVHAIITGESLSGEQLSAVNRILQSVSMLGPGVLKGLRRSSPGLNQFLTNFSKSASRLSGKAFDSLAKTLNISPDKMKAILAFIENEQVGEGMDFLKEQVEGYIIESTK